MKYTDKSFTIQPTKTERKCVGLDCKGDCKTCVKIQGKYSNYKPKEKA